LTIFKRKSFSISAGQLVAVGIIAFLSLLNCRGVREGKLVQNVMTVAKVLALGLLIVAGLTLAADANAVRTNLDHPWEGMKETNRFASTTGLLPHVPEFLVMLMVAGASMTGALFSADAWNNVTFTAGEVKNPNRNLPLSLALGTGVVIALYIGCNFIYLGALPLAGNPAGTTLIDRGIQYASEDRVATAVITQMFGSSGGKLMALAIMISGFGCCNGLILAGARVYYAMAKDGLFFRSVARLHPQHKTPVVSLMVQMVWTCILCISGSYGQLLDYIIFAVLVFYILTIAGLFVLRRTHPEAERPYKAIGYPVLPAIYIVMALFIDVVLLRYKPQYTWPGLFIVLLGIPVYYLWSLRTQQRQPRA
jgi:basic amino acid/polyamine antiporter, APA family